MNYRLEISGKALKDLKSLDAVTKKRIIKKLKFFLSQEDPLLFAKALVNSKDGDYRWRIGHYRIVFDANRDVILLLRIQHRSQVYKS